VTNPAHVELPTGVQSADDTVLLESGVVVQVCRASVRHANGPSVQITLLLDMQALVLPTEGDLSKLRGTASRSILAGLRTIDSGKVSAITLPEYDAASEDIALAAAVCAASWGWDESECIHVTVNDQQWDVTPLFRDGGWTATLA